jgi:ABC-type antimicrobial peptide transport system permease subunit
MQEEIVIPIVAFLTIFGIVYVVVTARNRERMSMIEKGVNPKDFLSAGPNVYGSLRWALLLVGFGLGLFIGSLFDTYSRIPKEPAYFGSAIFFGGLGLAVAFLIARRAER